MANLKEISQLSTIESMVTFAIFLWNNLFRGCNSYIKSPFIATIAKISVQVN